MEFCPTLEIIGDYFTKALQVYQCCCFRNIIIGIHEDDIPSYNSSGRAFFEEQKVKLYKDKKRLRRLPNFQATKATNDCVG